MCEEQNSNSISLNSWHVLENCKNINEEKLQHLKIEKLNGKIGGKIVKFEKIG